MFKKIFVAFASTVIMVMALCTSAFALDDPGREDEIYLTFYKVVESYEVCHENGVPYLEQQNPDEVLVRFEDGRYVVHFTLRSEDCNVLGTRRLALEEMLEPIISDSITEPVIETVMVTNHWRWLDTLEENATTEEIMYRLILPPHAIILSM